MHLPVLNILVEQLLSKFKTVCSVAKSTQQRTVCYVTIKLLHLCSQIKIFFPLLFFCVFVYNIKAWIQQ